MEFNPDPKKHGNEATLSRKSNSCTLTYPPVKVSNVRITKCSHQKHLGIVLDSKLNFNTHVAPKSVTN